MTPGDLGEDVEQVDPNEVEITTSDDAAPPATSPDDSAPMVNAALFDDPEEVARMIQEASGQTAEIVEIVDDEEGDEPAS